MLYRIDINKNNFNIDTENLKNLLNSTKNTKLIKINQNCDFTFLEENFEIKSPVSDYYFKTYDLSININLKFKWALYGYFFLYSIVYNFNDNEILYEITNSITDSLNNDVVYNKKLNKIIVDGIEMNDINLFLNELNNEYKKCYYEENSIISFKLKLNILEFISLQNTHYPRLCFYL